MICCCCCCGFPVEYWWEVLPQSLYYCPVIFARCAIAAYLPSAEVEGTVFFTVEFPHKSCDAQFESVFYPEIDKNDQFYLQLWLYEKRILPCVFLFEFWVI